MGAVEQTGEALAVKRDVDYDSLHRVLSALASPVRLRLLPFLLEPHHLEEIAAHLGVTRQAARRHVDQLEAIGVARPRPGARRSGPVTEYVLHPPALFLLHDEVAKLGHLQPQTSLLLPTSPEPAAAPAAPSGPFIAVLGPFAMGRRHPLLHAAGPVWTIGRDPTSAVPVAHDPYVSNRHAEVRWERGRFVLTDLGSTNGTIHNWAAVPRGSRVPLAHGDLLGVGRTTLFFGDAFPG